MTPTAPGSIMAMPDTPEGHDDIDPVTAALNDRQTALAVRPDLPSLMTTAEVASFLRVTDDTVRRWAEKGSMPSHRIQVGEHPRNQRLRFKREDVLAFLEGKPSALACGCGPTGGPDASTVAFDPDEPSTKPVASWP